MNQDIRIYWGNEDSPRFLHWKSTFINIDAIEWISHPKNDGNRLLIHMRGGNEFLISETSDVQMVCLLFGLTPAFENEGVRRNGSRFTRT